MKIRDATPEEKAAALAAFDRKAWLAAGEEVAKKERRDATGFPEGKVFGILDDQPYE